MGKSKRSKDLTHEEIWDDSALVRSWDDAVEEYQVRSASHNSRDRYLTVHRSSTTAFKQRVKMLKIS